jgi:hypothetical protein
MGTIQKIINKIKHNKYITNDQFEQLCWDYIDTNYHKLITPDNILEQQKNNVWGKINIWLYVKNNY